MNAIRRLVAIAAVAVMAGCGGHVNRDIVVPAGDTGRWGGSTVNGSVRVEDGGKAAGENFRTVNGSIRIGRDAEVGNCKTVNGSVEVGDNSSTGSLETVNGRLRVGRDVLVDGRIQTVNGGVRLEEKTTVDGDVETVNGRIEMTGATVAGRLANVNGGMTITDGSVVEGGLLVSENRSSDRNREPPEIVVGPDSEVRGDLVFEQEVRLYVHETATIGPVFGAEAIRYSGRTPRG